VIGVICYLGNPAAPTVPDAATRARVDAAWKRIETWLTAKAPQTAGTLGPPAAASTIADFERTHRVTLPPDLVASLLRHDGVAGGGFTLPPAYAPMSLHQILMHYLTHCDTQRDLVALAEAPGGATLLVDQRPSGDGRVVGYFAEQDGAFGGRPPTVADVLELTAESLESGRPFAKLYRPRVIDGTLAWEYVTGR
jgi:hypothetical protein